MATAHPLSDVAWPRLTVTWLAWFGLGLALFMAVLASLALGSVRIPVDEVVGVLIGQEASRPAWTTIVWDVRLPKAITAALAGAALAVSGLKMQTLFRNPLADPYVLGVSSGASLGVAVVLLGVGGGALSSNLLAGLGVFGELALAVAASAGAAVVMALILILAQRVRNTLTLLIVGLMASYLTGALVSLLIYVSQPERIQAFSIWSAGNFGGVTWAQLTVFVPVLVVVLALSLLLGKPLDALLLGETYARSLGIDVRRTRWTLIAVSSLLAGVTTAFCGPVGFLGVAVPHLARALFRRAEHRILLPACVLLGATLALLADVLSQLPGATFTLPLNVVTVLFGVPVVLWVILRRGVR